MWHYKYYCRMNTTDQHGFRSFDDPDQNCFSNQSRMDDTISSILSHLFYLKVVWKSNNSSVTILTKSLQLNQTYQFMVQIINQRDPSLQSVGYLFVTIVQIQSPLIVIR